MWNVPGSDQADIEILSPVCIEDINNGQYLNILIPAWPVTPTRRGNSHRIVPGPIITNYWQKLVCCPPPLPLYLGIQIHNNSQLDIFKACEIVPGSFRWNMWSADHVRTYQYCRTRGDTGAPLSLTLGAISWIPSTSNIWLIGQISHNWSNIWGIIKIFSMYGKVFPIMFFFRVISDCEAHHLVFSISNLSSLKCCCRSLSIFCYLKSKMSMDDQLS